MQASDLKRLTLVGIFIFGALAVMGLIYSYLLTDLDIKADDIKAEDIKAEIATLNYKYQLGSSFDDIETKPPATTVSYNETIDTINTKRLEYAKAYQSATSSPLKQQVTDDARSYYVTSMTTLLPYWYGTPWDFNGTSKVPQQGDIACGYYVTTVLEDSGLKVERNKLAQQASENIIKSLTSEAHIERFSNTSLDDFIEVIVSWGEGLYIVGLDFHVGYIWHDGQQIHFIHSSIPPTYSVLSEPANKSIVLANSNYRVLGKISEDDELIKKWLLGSEFKTLL